MRDFLEYIMKRWRYKKSLTQKEIAAKIKYKRWQREKEVLSLEQKIKDERYQIKHPNKGSMPTFGKLFLIFLFINFSLIELFTGWVTIKSFTLAYATGMMPDLTPLVTLIGTVIGVLVGLIISIIIIIVKKKNQKASE